MTSCSLKKKKRERRKQCPSRMQTSPETDEVPKQLCVFFGSRSPLSPDFLCLACQWGNYGASLRPHCDGVGRSLSNCPPELQTSSCISQICSHPEKYTINCSNGQTQGGGLVRIRILSLFSISTHPTHYFILACFSRFSSSLRL